ncbi:MAG: c-type cytochrome biogenesis protein CcmI, partial [Nitrosomonadaceae bacterium]|nr:c-type cytochrome biogenesis protein CcmI [Nitrosomonadaceae bacterium]
NLSGKPAELIYEALRIDPKYPKALALAGTVEFEQERYAQAAEHWEKLLEGIPADSPLAQSVKESIAEAKLLASGGKPAAPEQAVKVAESKQEASAQPVEKAVSSDSPAATSLSVSGQVSISSDMATKVSANDTLFIYARAKSGPKMPLAILRLKASDLPATFTLTDDMAMTPTMKMSSFPEVVIEARISKSGQAITASGDLQGFSEPVKLGHNNISIVINKQVP